MAKEQRELESFNSQKKLKHFCENKTLDRAKEIVNSDSYKDSLGRTGTGGAGHTLESAMGVKENNRITSDLPETELKTINKNHNTVTLFSKEPDWYKFWGRELLKRYGYHSKGKKRLNIVLDNKKSNHKGFNINKKDNYIKITHEDEKNPIAHYNIRKITRKCKNKLKNLLIFYYKKEKQDYNYYKAIHNTNFQWKSFVEQFEKGNIHVEIRMSLRENGIKNRGTSWRIKKNKVKKIYENNKIISE